MSNIFTAPDDTSQQMADSLPQGRAWAAKNIDTSNMRKLINSLAVVHNRSQQQIQLLDEEFRIDGTTDLLEEWETSVGLPDECTALSTTLALRRQAVIDRFRKKPWVTLSDLQTYVDNVFPEVGVILYPGGEYYPLEYELEATLMGDVSDRFIIVAEIPLSGESLEYTLELTIEGGINTDELECVLNKLLLANVLLQIEFVEA
jgi:hypothetical protein